MTKQQFIEKLATELKRNRISDTSDIIEEYEQHFAFKLADGYTEEEVSAKLGDPKNIAAQYDSATTEKNRGVKIFAVIGLGIADLFFGMLYILLFAWEIVMGTFAVACGSAAVCLICNLEKAAAISIPSMPYHCAVLFGIAFIALSILAVIAAIYFLGFIRQLIRSYKRFHKNMLASACGNAILPPVTVYPQFTVKAKRRLKKLSLAAATVFAACFIACFVVCIISAGTFEFWHAWNWFGYAN